MRTKALLGLAALAAGALTSMAQSNVYSLNVVGYVNVPVTANKFYLLVNPLNASGGNNVSNVFSGLADTWDSTAVYTYDKVAGITAVETFIGPDYHQWYPATTTLVPGQGFFLYPTVAGTVTFVGEVQTTNSISLTEGYNLVGSAFPSAQPLHTLGLWNGHDSDALYQYVNGSFSISTYVVSPPDFTGWFNPDLSNGGPIDGISPGVGEGFYYYRSPGAGTFTWTQNFTIQ